MEWFRYFDEAQTFTVQGDNENYIYPYARRKIPRFVPFNQIDATNMLAINLDDLDIISYYDEEIQKQEDQSSYAVVYKPSEASPESFFVCRSLVHENVLYFSPAVTHAAGLEISGQYGIYYNTPGLRYLKPVTYEESWEDTIPDHQRCTEAESPYVISVDEIENLTYRVVLGEGEFYTFSFVNSETDWTDGQAEKYGAKAYLNFSGPNLAIYGDKGPDFGKFEITIIQYSNEGSRDSNAIKKEEVDCFSSSYEEDALLFAIERPDLDFNEYVATVEIQSDKNPVSSGTKVKLSSYKFNYNAYVIIEKEELSNLLIMSSTGMIKL
jgi:hypothetical protein